MAVLSNNHFIEMKKAFRNGTIIQDAARLMSQKFHILFMKTGRTFRMGN